MYHCTVARGGAATCTTCRVPVGTVGIPTCTGSPKKRLLGGALCSMVLDYKKVKEEKGKRVMHASECSGRQPNQKALTTNYMYFQGDGPQSFGKENKKGG